MAQAQSDQVPDLKKFYISNCIQRIIAAPCSDRNVGRRAEDLAMAIQIAGTADGGTKDAHQYLIRLCTEAEAGKYKEV